MINIYLDETMVAMISGVYLCLSHFNIHFDVTKEDKPVGSDLPNRTLIVDDSVKPHIMFKGKVFER